MFLEGYETSAVQIRWFSWVELKVQSYHGGENCQRDDNSGTVE